MQYPPTFHAIIVRYFGPTNYRNSKISLYSPRFKQRIYKEIPDNCQGTIDAAIFWLNYLGFKDLSLAETENGYIVSSQTFAGIADRAKMDKGHLADLKWWESLTYEQQDKIRKGNGLNFNTIIIAKNILSNVRYEYEELKMYQD